jgi:6-phosphogluconolactonase
MNGELRVVDDVPTAFARLWIDEFQHRPSSTFVFGLSGGGTARRCYAKLADCSAGHVDWRAVRLVWVDERCVPPDSPHSNERLAREALIERIVAIGAVHPMRCDTGADSYAAILRQIGRIDLAHLGLGADGHTASLFPQSPALDAPHDRLVALNHDPSGTNPFPRMTLTLAGLARSQLAVFTIEGDEKRQAFAGVKADDPTVPAVHVRAERTIWIVDRLAAGESVPGWPTVDLD